jgi:hypothetical protein
MNNLLKVSLRQGAVYLPAGPASQAREITQPLGQLLGKLAASGFGVSEELLTALKQASPSSLEAIDETLTEVLGLKKNWTPLVKGWQRPTGESLADHIITFVANLFQAQGTRLPCGHIIPAGTFPLERYNGCPFCGTPFEAGALELLKQGSTVKVLELWKDADLEAYLESLLTSKVPLDATQTDSLNILVAQLPLPDVNITMKETLMLVIGVLVEQGRSGEAQAYLATPTDILRYLWYKHTGFLQLVEPRTVIKRQAANHRNLLASADQSGAARLWTKATLKLKYSRTDCARVASWLNNLEAEPVKICGMMHPKREMWIRFIRALRLAEYGKRKGFEKLGEVLDLFYNQKYEVWQGKVDQYRLKYDTAATMALLKQRPGMFARSLFTNMLWFDAAQVVTAFTEVIGQVPARLLVTLDMYAEQYFDPSGIRMVKPLGGIAKQIPVNHLVTMHDAERLDAMKKAVRNLCVLAMKKRFAAMEPAGKTVFIDPALFKIPLAIGDRAESVQDLGGAVTGTRFPVEGDTVRIFMQWGNGLAAQHLDMDLSCHVGYDGYSQICSYSSLVTEGCRHSGDIRFIPQNVGTAEYIDIDVAALKKAEARYVTFTCNAYSNGSITPNLVLGWMNSRFPMTISEATGVAYDPSCVQHQVRMTQGLNKGLVFGVLDVEKREIIWLEMPFGGQVVQQMDAGNIAAFLKKLESKLTIGQLLQIKAEAQQLKLVAHPEADEVYTLAWARNSAAVSRLLVD